MTHTQIQALWQHIVLLLTGDLKQFIEFELKCFVCVVCPTENITYIQFEWEVHSQFCISLLLDTRTNTVTTDWSQEQTCSELQ